MFAHVETAGVTPGEGHAVVTGRGGVRAPLADTDPVFGIPAEFAKVQP